MKRLRVLLCIIGVTLTVLGCHPNAEKPSASPPEVEESPAVRNPVTNAPTIRIPVTNEYHGVKVVDEFHWLEDAADPAVRDWTAGQNRRTRAHIDALPARPFIQERLSRLMSASSADYHSLAWRRGVLFLMKSQASAEQPILISLHSLTNLDSERLILDPAKLPNAGSSIDWHVPSRDGKLIAVSVSENGSEEGTLHIYSTAHGVRRFESIPRVQAPTAGGSAAWNADGTGLFYTRYPRKDERPDMNFHQEVYFHRLGTPVDQDVYEFGKDLPRIAEIELKSSPDGRTVLASAANGDGGEHAHYLRDSSGEWRQFARFEDQVAQVEFGRDPLYIEWGNDDGLYMLSKKGTPKGCILRTPLSNPSLTNAVTILPEGDRVIADFKPAASGIALVFLKGGPSQFAYLDYFDNTVREVEEQTPTGISGLLVTQGDDILFRAETYVEAPNWLLYSPTRVKDRIEATALAVESPVSFEDVEVTRETVRSKDGTEVPLNIIRKRGVRLDGSNPTILSGYGGFGISQAPRFDVARRVWLDHGGVFAIANLRGGGEFGETWHQAGALTNKQNVFDDFQACAEFLIRSNYTTTSKLGIRGGSNGGLLMGATLTQRPNSVRAVVAHVGLYDMLRAELDPNGAFNATEYGTIANAEQFQALYAYSPYHRVTPNTAYPAVLMLTGENDGRVNPAHSRKMTARLLSASSAAHPVLLRTSSGGHGAGTAHSERVEQLADVYAFFCEQLAVEFSLIDRGPWSGGVTATSAVVKAKLIREQLNARLLFSKSESLSDPSFTEPRSSEPAHGNIVQFTVEGLEPNTQYFYTLEVNGLLNGAKRGSFRTFPPPGPASFTFAFSGDARTGSTSEVFDCIREHRPLFFMNVGDFHYLNIRTNDPARFRDGYDAVLASPQQASLYRQVPFVYMWDDHDFTGNNSNRKAPAREAVRLVYDEYVPHYPLPLARNERSGGPMCQTFSVGRVKFIISDLRSERDDTRKKDDAAKSMMGVKQKAWFKKELLAANGKYPLICWVSSVAWIGQAGAKVYHGVKTNQFGFIHHSQLSSDPNSRTNRGVGPAVEDWWSAFTVERREIADFVKANRIKGLCILHADAHMLAADDGTNSDYATGGGAPIPIMCAAPLDKETSIKGGPYSQGVFRALPGEGCFGLVAVTDHGDLIDVAFSGRNHKNEEKISLQFSVPASSSALTASERTGL